MFLIVTIVYQVKNESDEKVVEWFPLKYEIIMVSVKDDDGVYDNSYSKKISQPFLLGFFILTLSKMFNERCDFFLEGF